MRNRWRIEDIEDRRVYHFSEIEQAIGISRNTLERWRKDGLLVVMGRRQSACTGQRLREAYERRLLS